MITIAGGFIKSRKKCLINNKNSYVVLAYFHPKIASCGIRSAMKFRTAANKIERALADFKKKRTNFI